MDLLKYGAGAVVKEAEVNNDIADDISPKKEVSSKEAEQSWYDYCGQAKPR